MTRIESWLNLVLHPSQIYWGSLEICVRTQQRPTVTWGLRGVRSSPLGHWLQVRIRMQIGIGMVGAQVASNTLVLA